MRRMRALYVILQRTLDVASARHDARTGRHRSLPGAVSSQGFLRAGCRRAYPVRRGVLNGENVITPLPGTVTVADLRHLKNPGAV